MKNKINICIDARMINDSGIGTYLRSLLPYISSEFKLVLLGDREKLSRYNLDVVPFNQRIYTVSEQFAYLSKVPACDIFWSPHYNVPLFPVRAKKRIVTIHDVNHIARKETYGFIARLYADMVMKRAVNASDKIITVSNFSKKEISKYFKNEDKINVIYNGVDDVLFKPVDSSREFGRVASAYNLPETYLLYIGNMKPHKNIEGLLKSYKLFKDKYNSDTPLLIVGKKEGFIQGQTDFSVLLKNLKLKEEKDVFVRSNLKFSDLPTVYSAAKVFLFLSYYEGFGLPILEAQSCSCPVISSDRTSLPEVCADTAVIVDPDNHQIVADKIAMLMTDKRFTENMTEKGLENVKRFSWQKSAEHHIKLIEAVHAS